MVNWLSLQIQACIPSTIPNQPQASEVSFFVLVSKSISLFIPVYRFKRIALTHIYIVKWLNATNWHVYLHADIQAQWHAQFLASELN